MKKEKEIMALTFEVSETEILFTIGEVSITISKREYLELIDRGVMEERFRVQEKPNAAFVELDNVASYAQVSRLSKKGLSIEEAARVMGVDGGVLRKFWDYALRAYKDRLGAAAEIERQGREEGDYCKTVDLYERGKTPNEVGGGGVPIAEIFVDAADVRRQLSRYQDAGIVAEKMKLELKDFRVWLEKNQKILDVLR